jgi:outer membrane lipoprotein
LALSVLFLLLSSACAPVFREEIMKSSTLNPELTELTASPSGFEGKMFILGGRIINTQVTEEGVTIEAVCLPVDSRGYIDISDRYRGRFLALMPKNKGLLDPLIFRPGKDVTVAGIYRGVRTSLLDDVEFSYSYFEIVSIRLWQPAYYYYYGYPYPYYYGPYAPAYYWYAP